MRILWLLSALILVACGRGGGGGGAADPTVLAEVERYYEAGAREQGGHCRQLEMGIVSSQVIESSAERITVEVRYDYRQPNARAPLWTNEQDPIWTGKWPKTLAGQCRGSGTRTFTVARRDGDDYQVMTMTGAQNDGIVIKKTRNPSIFGGY